MVYTVTGTANNCKSSQSASVTVMTISSSFIPSPDSGHAPLQVQFVNTSSGGSSYAWNYGNGLTQTTSQISDPAATTYTTPGTYTVVLMASNASLGCTAYDTLKVYVSQSYAIVIPNVFTPNGDNVNDTFFIKSSGVSTLSCEIYDRWGLKIYSWQGVNGFWDGSEKGGKAVDGTYYYVIQVTDVSNQNHKYDGFIQLLK